MDSIGHHRYEDVPIDEKYRWVQRVPGSNAVDGGLEYLRALAQDYTDSEKILRAGLGRLGVSWQGNASDSAASALIRVADWARGSQRLATSSGASIGRYRDSFDTLKSRIPEPRPQGEQSVLGAIVDGMWGVADDFGAAIGVHSDYRKREAVRRQQSQEATDALYAHEAAARAAVESFPLPEPPPTVLSSTARHGGADPPVPVGGGAPRVDGPPAGHVSPGATPSTGAGRDEAHEHAPPPHPGAPVVPATSPASTPTATPPPPGLPAPGVPPPAAAMPSPADDPRRTAPDLPPAVPPALAPGTGPTTRSGRAAGAPAATPPRAELPPSRPGGQPSAGISPDTSGAAAGTGPGRAQGTGPGGMPLGGLGARGGDEREHRNNVFIPSDEPFAVEFYDDVPAVLGLEIDDTP